MTKSIITILIIIGIFVGVLLWRNAGQFKLPKGETVELTPTGVPSQPNTSPLGDDKNMNKTTQSSNRKVFITDGVKHSIPLDEILSGGPPKDGIPSIDNPSFLSVKEADKLLGDGDFGVGIEIKGDAKFYPYKILVWHEIVNDTVGGKPVLITYCPLCATGIVFDRTLNGVITKFGTSGKLWQSNLLMYDRAENEDDESLWSQVLGEAVVGKSTGMKLAVLSSDIIEYGNWKKVHPDTKIISEDTGFSRNYGIDPYGDYYTSPTVSFGAEFTDKRLEPKEFVLGVQLNGKFKAYPSSQLAVGKSTDTIGGETITIDKSAEGIVRMFKNNNEPLQYIGSFWFSWAAVHPETEVYK